MLFGSNTPAKALDLATLFKASRPVTIVVRLACQRMFFQLGPKSWKQKEHDFRTHLPDILLCVVPLTQSCQHCFGTGHGILEVGVPWVEAKLQADATRHEVLDGVVTSAHLLVVHKDLVTHHLRPPKQRPMQENALANECMLFTHACCTKVLQSSLAAQLEETQQADEEQAAVLAKSVTTKNCSLILLTENITELQINRLALPHQCSRPPAASPRRSAETRHTCWPGPCHPV